MGSYLENQKSIEKLIGNKIIRLGKVEAPAAEQDEKAPAKRGRKTAAPKDKVEKPVEAKAPRAEKPVAEKPVRAKSETKPSPEPVVGDDGWNGPMPGFLSVGFGS